MEKGLIVHALALKLQDIADKIEDEADVMGRVPNQLIERAEDILREIKKNQ